MGLPPVFNSLGFLVSHDFIADARDEADGVCNAAGAFCPEALLDFGMLSQECL